MNFRTTITLLLLVIVVGILYFLSRGTPGTDQVMRSRAGQAEAGAGEPLFTADELSTAAVSRVVIVRGGRGRKRIVLEKTGQDWRQVEPVSFGLSSWMGGQVVDQMATLRAVEKVTPGKGGAPSLQEMGLEEPAATVTLQWTEAPEDQRAAGEQVVRFGKQVGGLAYVQRGGRDEVYVVGGGAVYDTAVNAAPHAWRRKTVQTPAEAQASGVVLTSPSGTVSLQRHGGRWHLDEQGRQRASKDAIITMLNTARNAPIAEFVTDAPATLRAYGLDEPAVVLRMTTAGQNAKPQASSEGEGKATDAGPAQVDAPAVTTLRIGAATNLTRERFFAALTRDDAPVEVVFSVEAKAVEALRKDTSQLRDPAISVVRASDVNTVAIEHADGHGGGAVRVERGPSGWSFAESAPGMGPGYGVESGAVLEVVNAVVDARARGFEPAPGQEGDGAASPSAVIRLGVLGGGEPEVIRLYPHGDDAWLAVRGQETIGEVVERSALAKALAPAIALRDRVVWNVAPEALVGLRVERGGQVFDFTREAGRSGDSGGGGDAKPQASSGAEGGKRDGGQDGSGGTWRLMGAERFNAEALLALVEAVTPVRAESWLVGAEESALGASLQLTITTADGTRRVLTVNSVTRVAHLEGEAAPFVAASGLGQAMGAEFRYRTLIEGPVGGIESVTVDDDGGEAVTIARDASGRYVGDGVDGLSEAAAGGLFDTLAGLRAQRYIDPPATWRALRTLTLTMLDGSTRRVAVGPGGVVRIGDAAEGSDAAATWAQVDADAQKAITAALREGAKPLDVAEVQK